jgi:hypothetical protein
MVTMALDKQTAQLAKLIVKGTAATRLKVLRRTPRPLTVAGTLCVGDVILGEAVRVPVPEGASPSVTRLSWTDAGTPRSILAVLVAAGTPGTTELVGAASVESGALGVWADSAARPAVLDGEEHGEADQFAFAVPGGPYQVVAIRGARGALLAVCTGAVEALLPAPAAAV